MQRMNKIVAILTGLFASLWFLGPVAADTYPSHPITIVVPYNAGGTTDTVARIIAQHLGAKLGQPVLVENKPGTSGTVGAAFVARAKPDGYTLLMGTISTHATNPSLYKSLPYDNIKDFAPISMCASSPNMLIVNPEVPATNVAELIELLKKNPGKYTYGSNGAGTSQHLIAELFKTQTGTDILHVPYKGSGKMIIDVVAGHIDMSFDNMPTALGQMKANKVRALAVTSLKRVPQAPDVPTLAETLPGFQAGSWQGLFAPAGVPDAILDKLNAAVQEVLNMKDVEESFQKLGATPEPMSRADFTAFVKSETERWAKVIGDAGLSQTK